MSTFGTGRSAAARAANAERRKASAGAVDQGLRRHMLGVYNRMSLGIALTGLIAGFSASSSDVMALVFGTPLQWVVLVALFVIPLVLGARLASMSLAAANATFWGYVALMGVALAPVMLAYDGDLLAVAFAVTSAAFAGLSLYGYTTGRNLDAVGSFLVMGMIGVCAAGLVNLFIHSSAILFVTSCAGVLVFAGMTAWDTQKVRDLYDACEGDERAKASIVGALILYLDFINLFLYLLRLLAMLRSMAK